MRPKGTGKERWHGKEARRGERLEKNYICWKLLFMSSEKQWGQNILYITGLNYYKRHCERWEVGRSSRDPSS